MDIHNLQLGSNVICAQYIHITESRYPASSRAQRLSRTFTFSSRLSDLGSPVAVASQRCQESVPQITPTMGEIWVYCT